jgi:hypothetical protein
VCRPLARAAVGQKGRKPLRTRKFSSGGRTRLHAEELGADLIFGWDQFHRPEIADLNQGIPVLDEIQPDVTNFEGWTALASWGEITHRWASMDRVPHYSCVFADSVRRSSQPIDPTGMSHHQECPNRSAKPLSENQRMPP